jgi:hypothetical protein
MAKHNGYRSPVRGGMLGRGQHDGRRRCRGYGRYGLGHDFGLGHGRKLGLGHDFGLGHGRKLGLGHGFVQLRHGFVQLRRRHDGPLPLQLHVRPGNDVRLRLRHGRVHAG